MIFYKPPSDKSITVRAVVLAAISGEKTYVRNPLLCDDTLSSIKALKKLGCSVDNKDRSFVIKGPGLYGFKGGVLSVGESGLFLRLILPILLNQGLRYRVVGRGTILRRDFKDTIRPFLDLGANIEHNNWHLPFVLYPSKISGGRFETDSAQVKSSLLIASLYGLDIWVKERSKVRDHTERMLKYLGVRILNNNGYIKASGRILSKDFEIFGDLSSASAIIATSVLRKTPLRVKDCFLNRRRIGFLNLLKRAGVGVEISVRKIVMNEPVGDVTIIPSGKIYGVCVDEISDMIDEVPLAFLVLSYAEGISKIKGVSRISNKESDRLKFTIEMLKKLGSFLSYRNDTIVIKGGRVKKVSDISTSSDHRSAMVCGVIKAVNNPSLKIRDPRCVSKTYPNFWKDMREIFNVSL